MKVWLAPQQPNRPDLAGPRGVGCAHLLEDVPARAFDMAADEFGRLVGVAGLDELDQFAMIAHHLARAATA